MATSGVDPAKIPADPKRIIIACDGTWDDDNYGMEQKDIFPWSQETAKPPSNVTRLCRSILPFDDAERKQQIVYYQAGIGSEHNLKDKLWGGLTGFGISEHVREAYAFLCHNYVVRDPKNPKLNDEIIITGFSRGAFTARTIAAMVADLGLLSMKGMTYFFPIFKDWENQIVKGYVSPFQEPWPPGTFESLREKPNIKDEDYKKFLFESGYIKHQTVTINCVAVWDTVGALGIPSLGLFPGHPSLEYTFVDTMVPDVVNHAFHALALDEHRLPFTPTIWETPQNRKNLDLKQCWFPGVHANIGGGYPDTMASDITLAWMISQMIKENIISEKGFDMVYIRWLWELNKKYYGDKEPKPSWGMGRIDESLTSFYKLTHSLPRTPDQYWETDGQTGKPKNVRCQGTKEHVHASVRIRKGLHGRGLDNNGVYNPPALKDWTCTGVDSKNPRWTLPGHIMPGQKEPVMEEDELLPLELELMQYISPYIYDNLWKIQGSASQETPKL